MKKKINFWRFRCHFSIHLRRTTRTHFASSFVRKSASFATFKRTRNCSTHCQCKISIPFLLSIICEANLPRSTRLTSRIHFVTARRVCARQHHHRCHLRPNPEWCNWQKFTWHFSMRLSTSKIIGLAFHLYTVNKAHFIRSNWISPIGGRKGTTKGSQNNFQLFTKSGKWNWYKRNDKICAMRSVYERACSLINFVGKLSINTDCHSSRS